MNHGQDWLRRYLDRYYSRARGFVDGTAEFHALCREAIRPDSRILELGAGPANATSSFLATLGTVEGLDPDPDVRTNPALAAAWLLEGDRFPFPDGVFDACVSNYVVEHVPDPLAHLTEVRRVLVPGGVYALRTPNRYHYVALVSGLTPHWVHRRLANRLRRMSEESHAPYPTVYAMNTRRRLRRLAGRAGLRVERLSMIEKEPSYGFSSRPLFLAFMAYERIVNASEALAGARANMLCVLRAPG